MADLNRPRIKSENLVWDVGTLTWVAMTQPGGGGGGSGTEYVEDAVSPANPTAGALNLRRRDTLINEVTTSGDWITANATAGGELYTKDVDALSSLNNVDFNTATANSILTTLLLPQVQVDQDLTPLSSRYGIQLAAVRSDTPSNNASTVPHADLLQISGGRLWVRELQSTVATTSQVADSASSVTILAANDSRLGATIFNDSSAILYLKLGTTATTTDYTVQLPQNAYYEVPAGYTQRIDGIWASDPGTGAARVTELT